jgi:hypothetical protein
MRWRVWSSRWNKNCQGKPKHSDKPRPRAILFTTNPTWPEPAAAVGSRRLTAWAMARPGLELTGLVRFLNLLQLRVFLHWSAKTYVSSCEVLPSLFMYSMNSIRCALYLNYFRNFQLLYFEWKHSIFRWSLNCVHKLYSYVYIRLLHLCCLHLWLTIHVSLSQACMNVGTAITFYRPSFGSDFYFTFPVTVLLIVLHI